MIKYNNIVLFILFFIIVIAGCDSSPTEPEDNFTFEEIQAAIDSAAAGDTVFIPAGRSTWSERVEIRKEICIFGAGMDSTTIIRVGEGEAFYVNVDVGDTIRVSGMTIDGNSESIGINSYNAKNFRIDNIEFLNCRRGIILWNYSYGVVDHNIFFDVLVEGVLVYGDDSVGWDREDSYLTAYGDNLGHPEFVFIEDNDFIYSENAEPDYVAHVVASNHGARYVLRYNNIDAVYIEDQLHVGSIIDVHGNFFYGRGTVAFELYNNVINSEHSFRGMNIRGGTGVIFGNTFTGDFTHSIHMTNYRSWNTPSDESPGDCPVGDYDPCCCPEDYPCVDQINNLYIWDNTYNGSPVQAEVDDRGYNTVHIQENRDYSHEERPGYTPYTYPHPLVGD